VRCIDAVIFSGLDFLGFGLGGGGGGRATFKAKRRRGGGCCVWTLRWHCIHRHCISSLLVGFFLLSKIPCLVAEEQASFA
jgi:hypothetical protein